jgi:putative phosphoserine phosphatase/1-acylglycerol-3-phosphate O-acyltransferase
MTRAQVIPIGVWGTERVWPRNSQVPQIWNVMNPPTVTTRVGPAVELAYDDLEKDTERIMTAIADLLPPEARQPHEPTLEELAATFPSNYQGDPEAEDDRRPGTD